LGCATHSSAQCPLSLRKNGDDHVETIHEKLRRQQAEIEQVDAAGKPIRRA
jgi:hypothetical protein